MNALYFFSHAVSTTPVLLQHTVHLEATTRASHSWTSHSISLWHLRRSSLCLHSPKRSHTSTSLRRRTTTSMPPSPSPSPPVTWSTRASPRPPLTRCSPARPSKPGNQQPATFTGRLLPRDTPPPPCTAPVGDMATHVRGSRA